MSEQTRDLTALIGSRICHDLISPIGAIGNGLELMSMSGGGASPELSLISESVNNANARIRFYRIAYGASSADQALGRPEITSVLDEITKGARLRIRWLPPGEIVRREVKAAFLVLQCYERAMPYGGDVEVDRRDGRWTFTGTANKLKIEGELWQLLSAPDLSVEVLPSQVQFALVPDVLAAMNRQLVLRTSPNEIVVQY